MANQENTTSPVKKSNAKGATNGQGGRTKEPTKEQPNEVDGGSEDPAMSTLRFAPKATLDDAVTLKKEKGGFTLVDQGVAAGLPTNVPPKVKPKKDGGKIRENPESGKLRRAVGGKSGSRRLPVQDLVRQVELPGVGGAMGKYGLDESSLKSRRAPHKVVFHFKPTPELLQEAAKMDEQLAKLAAKARKDTTTAASSTASSPPSSTNEQQTAASSKPEKPEKTEKTEKTESKPKSKSRRPNKSRSSRTSRDAKSPKSSSRK